MHQSTEHLPLRGSTASHNEDNFDYVDKMDLRQDSGGSQWKLVGAAIFTLVLATTVCSMLYTKTNQTAFIWRGCGTDPERAREQGCVFDVMMNGWIPVECYHRNLSEAYIAQGNFKFFAMSGSSEEEIPLEMVRRGENMMLKASYNHHLLHCAYMWQLQSLALLHNGPIDSKSLDHRHTAHCAEMMVQEAGIGTKGESRTDKALSIIEIDFLSCRDAG